LARGNLFIPDIVNFHTYRQGETASYYLHSLMIVVTIFVVNHIAAC
jgi:hypothetical protein